MIAFESKVEQKIIDPLGKVKSVTKIKMSVFFSTKCERFKKPLHILTLYAPDPS